MKFKAFEPINLKEVDEKLKVVDLPLSKIVPNHNQPRKHFDKESLEELALSLKQHGVIQPIIVKNLPKVDKYQIIAGERRWRASKLINLNVIPAIIKTSSEEENIAISLIENIQREQLNPIELAETFFLLNSVHDLSHETIAEMVGKNRTTITNIMRLMGLSRYVKDLLIEGKLEMGHARTLLTLPLEDQDVLAQKIVEKNLTVREAEKLSQASKTPLKKDENSFELEVNNWVNKLTKRLSSEVKVKINEKGQGTVSIQFYSPEEVDWLVNKILE